METNPLTILAIAGGAAIASPLGGLLALWHRPNTLAMSAVLGFASGVLLATIGFEMMPQALELSGSLPVAVTGFVAGFAAVYGFDLFIHRGVVAGEKAEQHRQVERFYQRRHPRGGEVILLAGGTSAEELIEGVAIGVGAAIKPGLGILVALAIVIDNLAEGMSIGEIVRNQEGEDGERSGQVRRILGWTGLIGASLFVSTLAGWYFLRGLSHPVQGFLFAVGAGGMFYLTIGDLVPHAEERHYQQSAAIATGAGFMVIFALSQFF